MKQISPPPILEHCNCISWDNRSLSDAVVWNSTSLLIFLACKVWKSSFLNIRLYHHTCILESSYFHRCYISLCCSSYYLFIHLIFSWLLFKEAPCRAASNPQKSMLTSARAVDKTLALKLENADTCVLPNKM